MQAGKLWNQIELQRTVTTRDSYGEPIDSWSTYKQLRAEFIGGAGREAITGQQVTGRGSCVWRIRYLSPEPKITKRVKFGTRTFDINEVENVKQRNRELLLTCTEVL